MTQTVTKFGIISLENKGSIGGDKVNEFDGQSQSKIYVYTFMRIK